MGIGEKILNRNMGERFVSFITNQALIQNYDVFFSY